VTRGDYPDLVKNNLARNLDTCQRVSMENYLFEIVTDKKIDLPENKRVRQVCVRWIKYVIVFRKNRS
jgi:egghead protein (zeste-white 4 protein)